MAGNILSLLTAAGAFAADRLTKHIADKKLGNGPDAGRTAPGTDPAGKAKNSSRFIQFRKATNSGFACNRLESHRTLVVAVSTVVFAVCVVLYAVTLAKPALYTMKAGMGLMLGGAAGNVYDRVVKGKVTDFIVLKPINKVIFNMADVFILVGAVVTTLCELLQGTD